MVSYIIKDVGKPGAPVTIAHRAAAVRNNKSLFIVMDVVQLMMRWSNVTKF